MNEIGKLKVDGDYLVHENERRTKLYRIHKSRHSGQIGDLTAVSKSIILQEHALNKNKLHDLLAEPKTDKYIKHHIADRNRHEARGISNKYLKQLTVELVQNNKKNHSQMDHLKRK